jgi:hypothetical protein
MIKRVGGSDAVRAVIADAELLFVFFARFRDTLPEGISKIAAERRAIGAYRKHGGNRTIRMADSLYSNWPRTVLSDSRSVCDLGVQLANLQTAWTGG